MCTGSIPIRESSFRSSWNIFLTATPIASSGRSISIQAMIVLDPFAGSGTTLVQANELGMHSVGLDISHFNCLIAETKLEILQPELRARQVPGIVPRHQG